MAQKQLSSSKKRTKKVKDRVSDAVVHVKATFNNTLITITDAKGNALSWSSAGEQKFSGSRKSTPYAAQVATEVAAKKAKEIYGVENVEVYIKGPGPGREAAIRAARNFFIVTGIYDMTGIPFNGVRAPNERRV
ncbi:MAG: 30S ribosomal protein S11 [Legionellales bacterium]|nr:30S ribosomal protein S11 [Legionellales bacterium]|tara:strand:- start:1133 stop:1534 length:402 start_codon:yes stop_codon:yes gene_type:complete